MRISIITETYFPQVNGVSRTLGQLVAYLASVGDEVQLLRPDYGAREDTSENGAAEVVAVRAVRLPFYRELYLPTPPFGRIRRALDAFRPDLVHIATEATLGLVALLHCRRRGIPVVSSFHTNFDQYSKYYRVSWLRGAAQRYLRWFHRLTLETYVPSLATIARLESRGFERLALWRRGVDAELFRPDRPGRAALRAAYGFSADDVVVAHVGRLAAEKNVDFLAPVFERIHATHPRLKFLIVGDGPERPALERSLGEFSVFAGYRAGIDLADHYAAADLFAFASRTETFGNVVLEALASGLPVVALAEGGVVEIVEHGVDGTLVPADAAPRAFADALLTYIDDDALRRLSAEAARHAALAQSWAAVMAGLRARYLAVLDAARRPAAPEPASSNSR